MRKRRWGWKCAALLMCLVAIASLVRPGRSGAVANAIDDIIGVVCAAGLVQYAFGWPRLPRLWWRISGPLISLVLIGKGASMLGWLGTRLAIRPLTFPEQLATAGAILAKVW
jgi:hypothetical protein